MTSLSLFLIFLISLSFFSLQTLAETHAITIFSTSGLRGSLWPSIDKTNPPETDCFDIYEDFDSPHCLGGCSRRISLKKKLHESHGRNFLTVDLGGIYFGNDEVSYTMYGTTPYEKCVEAMEYDVLSLGGADLYVGLDTARDFFTEVGQVVSLSGEFEERLFSTSIFWKNTMESGAYLFQNGQTAVFENEKATKAHYFDNYSQNTLNFTDSMSVSVGAQQQIIQYAIPPLELQQLKENLNQNRNDNFDPNGSNFHKKRTK